MIWYSDCIVKENDNVLINLHAHRPTIIGSDIVIYQNGEIVYKGLLSARSAHIELPPPRSDMEHFTIVLSDRLRRISLPFTVMRLRPDDRYIVCDIDFTISATNAFQYLMRHIVGLKTIGDSPSILRGLAEKYRIIYLTGRVELYTKMSRMWLEKNHYPVGPILARPKDYPFHLAAFKSDILKKITAISTKGIGIGDLKSDIIAYLSSGIIPIKIKHPFNYYKSRRVDCELKDGYYLIKSWYGIERLFKEKRFYLDKE